MCGKVSGFAPENGENMTDIILDTLTDGIKLVPFLFLTYLVMEALEHTTAEKTQKKIRQTEKAGPLLGGILGVMPQCGFSAAASELYAGRLITVGTLLAIFLSTSDEMLPILISETVPAAAIAKILAVKVLIAVITGFFVDFIYVRAVGKRQEETQGETVCVDRHQCCDAGILVTALKHTGKIFVYILLISFALNVIIEMIGRETLAEALAGAPVIRMLVAGAVGLIPNCASSVMITQLFLDGMLDAGAMMAGLLVNAGVGILVLVRLNRNSRQNLKIIAALYGFGIFWGTVIRAAGITFI